jgi:DNA helicase II / ATP-dependent DNA helicase PcrA
MSAIYDTLISLHTHGGKKDKEQLDAIFSSASHLVIEAPAGYGKTRTMVSKIAYMITTGQVPYPKKILALTFSINAAFKIRRDIGNELPSILSASDALSQNSKEIVYVTNYHGLCRRILGNYGYLISQELGQIDILKGIGINYRTLQDRKLGLTNRETEILLQYSQFVTKAAQKDNVSDVRQHLKENTDQYLQIVKEKFLTKGQLPFDAILLFTLQLFKKHPEIRKFYRIFFHTIIVDEFQDTNILQWTLLKDIVGRSDETQNSLFVLGDRNQKIYEFIGAMEGIIDTAKSHFNMQEIKLITNHRFKNNPDQLRFDENLRRIAQNPCAPNIKHVAEIEVIHSATQDEEARQILSLTKTLLIQNPTSTIAILTRVGKKSNNTLKIVDFLNKEKDLSYFFALYSDEDDEYVEFHRECSKVLSSYRDSERGRRQSFRYLSKYLEEEMERENPSATWSSLQTLLKTFLAHVIKEFRFLLIQEKILLVDETLRNKALKQYLMYVNDAQVMISTIHGSKGLEWDYVILPDVERYILPHKKSLCTKLCKFQSHCRLDLGHISLTNDFLKPFIQELNLFYVGGTRAKERTYFTYSDQGLEYDKTTVNNPSCFLSLEGFKITPYRETH